MDFKKLLNSKSTKETYKILRLLCGPTRFEIVILLKKHKKGFTVTKLARALNSSLSRVSHQLSILKKHKLVLAKRINREIIYTLANHRINKTFSF